MSLRALAPSLPISYAEPAPRTPAVLHLERAIDAIDTSHPSRQADPTPTRAAPFLRISDGLSLDMRKKSIYSTENS
jgi:hypothetical protein